MRLAFILVFALLVGCLGGLGTSWYRFQQIPFRFMEDAAANTPAIAVVEKPPSNGPIPVASVLNGEEFDFGEMELHGTGSHVFQFQNVGTAPLTLKTGKTTCKCTHSGLTQDRLEPGQVAEVKLEWIANRNLDGEDTFAQSADILTNDPSRPVIPLVIRGRIKQEVVVFPSDIALSDVPSSSGVEATAHVVCYRPEDFRLLDPMLLGDETRGFFEVQVDPLSEAELSEKHPGAHTGYLVKLRAKPGLPLGAIIQTIRFHTTLSDKSYVEIPVTLQVISDISLFALRGWDRASNTWTLGVVPRDQGIKSEFFLMVKGENQRNAAFTILSVEPRDLLTVRLGDPVEMSNGKVTRYPVHVEIPAGSRTADCQGTSLGDYARIVIGSNDPVQKTIRVRLSFLIE